MIVVRSLIALLLVTASRSLAQDSPRGIPAAALAACRSEALETPEAITAPGVPDRAQKARLQGLVAMRLYILPSGQVDYVRVLKGFNPLLDRSASSAACGWLFSPISDSAIRTSCVVIDYRLEGSEKSAFYVAPWYLRVSADRSF